MAQKLRLDTLRKTFKTVDKESLQWFPGHMNKGLKQMQHKLRQVDCIIEVHDARIPFSGRNANFKYTLSGIKPHILVMNKSDMIKSSLIKPLQKRLEKENQNVIFTNCKSQQCRGIKQLFPLAQELIKQSDRYNRSEAEDFNMMIIGVPNVGKSSLINNLRNKHLRKGNASAVGAAPGITRSVLNKIKICEKPLFYLFDTPGILTPSVPSTEVGLKLALCNTIQDHLVGNEVIADYLLFWMNSHEYFKYVDALELPKPTDTILEVLTHIAMRDKKFLKVKDENSEYLLKPDLESAARLFIKQFRNLEFGRIMLDPEYL